MSSPAEGLRDTAKLSECEYPDICEMIHNDFYVDDCLSGERSQNQAYQRADELNST